MKKKLAGYSLLSFFSFCAFSIVFRFFAHAQTPTPPLFVQTNNTKITSIPITFLTPTPIFIDKKTSVIQLISPTPTETPIPTPTDTPVPTATPMPTEIPTPQPTIVVATDLETLFNIYSNQYHVDRELLKKIARCESGFNSQAVNDIYVGMFQFAETTWTNTRTAMGMDPNPDLRKNAEESIRTAAYMISRGEQNAWKSCD